MVIEKKLNIWNELVEKVNNRLAQCLDKEGALREGQACFRLNRGCMDNVYTLNEIVQGKLRENKTTYHSF